MKKRISDLLDGYEDGRVELSGDTPLSSARIRELTMKQIKITGQKGRLPRVLGVLAAAAACVGLIFLAGRAFWGAPVGEEPRSPDPGVEVRYGTGPDIGDIPAGCGVLPGRFEPVLCLNGTYYRWFGLNQTSYDGYVDEDGRTHVATACPEGSEAVGEISVISHVTEEGPGELEMQAGFDASGTVYANPERPAVVYVLMNTDWFADAYVRFTADYYESGLIRFEDRLYWFAMGYGDKSEYLEELPEGCVSAGTLQVIDKDLIPAGQLEINLSGDSYGYSLEGREVFCDPADDSVIYIYEEQFWREGSYPAWVACHLWPYDPA